MKYMEWNRNWNQFRALVFYGPFVNSLRERIFAHSTFYFLYGSKRIFSQHSAKNTIYTFIEHKKLNK